MSPSRPFGRGGLNFFASIFPDYSPGVFGVFGVWDRFRIFGIRLELSPLKAQFSSVDFSQLSSQQWVMAIVAALCVGVSKSGFGGLGMLTVTLMAAVMKGHELESTGVVLPLLICGDLFAVAAFRKHARWSLLIGLLPPAVLGVIIGHFWMLGLSNAHFKPIIGGLILFLTLLQFYRQLRPERFQALPHGGVFAWGTGISAGVTTMIANAAGPIMALYLLAVRLPKMELVGTGAYYFLLINLFKVPFSANLGFITKSSLLFNAALIPFVGVGIWGGRWLLHRIDQKLFERLLLILIVLTALHLLFS